MKKEDNILKLLYIPIIYFVTACLIEVGTFLSLNFGVFPKYFLFDISVMLIFVGIIFISSNRIAQFVISLLLLLGQALISFINITLYNIYGDLFSFDMIAIGAEGFKSFDASFVNYWFVVYLVVCITASIVFMVKDINKKYNFKVFNKMALVLASVFVVFELIGFNGYYTQIAWLSANNNSEYDKYFNNDKNLYETLFIKNESLKKYGSFGFYAKNLSNLIWRKGNVDADYTDTKEYILNSEMNSENMFTGTLKDDNVIVIMCESLEWYGIDPILTPTLYKLFTDGVTFNNYYSKSKTNYSEMDVILGNIPTNNSFTNGVHFANSSLLNNKLPFTLPNKFKASGYDQTTFFHNNDGSFYGRTTTHPVYGFDNIVTLEKMDFSGLDVGKEGSYYRDSDMIKACINQIAPLNKKFLSFITTVVTHGPYKENPRLNEYYKILDGEKFEESLTWLENNTNYVKPTTESLRNILKLYKAAFMDLDRGVEYLLNYLKNNNLMDNTTLVLYSDHNAYYHDLAYEMRTVNKGEYYNNEVYRVPASIYSEKLGNMNIDKFSCPYNILPTIFDLVGINYNKNLYMAPSIFDEEFKNTIFVSPLSGIMGDGIYSDNVSSVYLLKDNISDEDVYNFKQLALKYYQKQEWINKIYNTNIFKYYPELNNNI